MMTVPYRARYTMGFFDLLGDPAWGQSFGCLEKSEEHEWIKAVTGNIQFIAFDNMCRLWNTVSWFQHLVPRKAQEMWKKSYRFAEERIDARLQPGNRGDFCDRLVVKSAESTAVAGEGMSHGEMLNNAAMLTLAMVKTSSTTLS
jgi:versicolorin B desaturase